jgi:hypothetical protein
MMAEFFAYAVDKRLFPSWLPFGVHPGKDGVTITDAGTLLVTYGFLRLETPLTNISGGHVTAITGGGPRRAPEGRLLMTG